MTGAPPPRLVLASGSPRRREMLARLGLELEIRPVDLDETPRGGEDATALAVRLAREKAEAAARPGELVLAADTVVTLEGELLGKPTDREDARRMLRTLSAREHRVVTGVAIRDRRSEPAATVEGSASTSVGFALLDEATLDAYVATGEGDDKAGAYAVQGLAALFVDRIEGSWSNVVGLPLHVVARLLDERGVPTARLLAGARPA